MCGFIGLLRPDGLRPDDERRLAAGDDAQRHRGPDGQGMWRDPAGRFLVLHRRLAIRDPAHGAQPFLGRTRGTVLAYNGEVYNAEELRATLVSRGHAFEGSGDTDVVSAQLEEHGEQGLDAVEGMYAVASYNPADGSLLLAVDRNGEKPLFVASLPDGGILFASELRAMLATDLVSRRLDRTATSFWVAMGHVPAPGTLIAGVEKLPPAAWQRYDARGHRTHVGTVRLDEDAGESDTPRSFAQAVDRLDAAVASAVERQMISDRPLAVLLSGGIDSGLVASLASARRQSVHTLTISFPGSAFDESAAAEAVARSRGTVHRTLVAEATAAGFFDCIERDMDEPVADGAFYALSTLCRAAARHAVVLLAGEGADELFFGYDGWRADWRVRRWGRAAQWAGGLASRMWPRGLRGRARLGRIARPEWARVHALAAPRLDPLGGGWGVPTTCSPDPVREFLHQALPPESIRGRDDALRALRRWSLSVALPAGLLVKADRASMAASVELRVPLLDVRVRRLAHALPIRWSVGNGQGKRLLRTVFARYAPPGHAALPKMGLRPPFAAWLRGPLRESARTALLAPDAPTRPLFHRSGAEALLDLHDAGPEDHHDELLGMLILDVWMRRHGIQAP